MRKQVLGALGLGVLVTIAGCGRPAEREGTTYEAGPEAKRYPITGVVRGTSPGDGRITVAHEAIPDFMDAMTMSFAVKEGWAVKVATPGDRLTGVLVVDGARSWIEGTSLTKPPEGAAGTSSLDDATAVAIGPAPGTPLPSTPLRDQSGREVTAKTFAGRDLVITFIYTSCPLPDFCPLMMTRLNEAAARLRKADRRDDVQMIAISIDPVHDTPQVLARYGRTHIEGEGDDPFRRWSLLTGTPEQVRAWASFFALAYEKDGAEIAHGLRTAVVDREGRVVGVLRGNDWSTNDLMALLPDR